MAVVPRNLTASLLTAAQRYPVVTVTGPRQSGKTTLCQAAFPGPAYVSLEPLDNRDFAHADPRGFLEVFADGAVIDEIQNAPQLTSSRACNSYHGGGSTSTHGDIGAPHTASRSHKPRVRAGPMSPDAIRADRPRDRGIGHSHRSVQRAHWYRGIPAALSGRAKERAVRVVLWNLAYWKPGQFKRYENRKRQWAFLAELAPDVALLQECRPGDLVEHAPRWLADDYTILGEMPAGWVACSAVLARRSLLPSFIPPEDADGLSARASRWVRYLSGQIARVEIEDASGSSIRVVSVHSAVSEVTDDDAMTPAEHEEIKRLGCKRAWHNDLVVAALRDWVGHRFVVGGDWNTARAFDKQCNDPYECGRQFFDRNKARGWAETLRSRYPEEVQTYLDPKHFGNQLDHLFTDLHTHDHLVSCEVLRGAAVDEMSDHAPVLADFERRLPKGSDDRASGPPRRIQRPRRVDRRI